MNLKIGKRKKEFQVQFPQFQKVDISWFKAIKTEKTIEFATTFNVVYGEESLKQSIAKGELDQL